MIIEETQSALSPSPQEVEVTVPEVGTEETPLPTMERRSGRKPYGHLDKKDEAAIIKGIREFKPLYVIARELGVCRYTLHKYLKEKMEISYRDMRESMLDVAENRLFKNILDGNQNAIQFFLDRQGRHRGYGERQQASASEVPIINIGRIEIQKPTDDRQGKVIEAEVVNA